MKKQESLIILYAVLILSRGNNAQKCFVL